MSTTSLAPARPGADPTSVLAALRSPSRLRTEVLAGLVVALAMVFFARRVAHFTEVVDVGHPDEDTRAYAVRGALFFASSNDLVSQFDDAGDRRTW